MVIAQVRSLHGKVMRYKLADIRSGKAHPVGRLLGYEVLHHRTPGLIGKPINATKKPVSLAKAESIHRAIMYRRYGGK